MDIIAMLQKSSTVKPKTSAYSFGSSTEKTSFDNALSEARRNTSLKSTEKQASEPVKQEPVKENKAEKLAKVMSNNKTASEKLEDKSTEVAKENQKVSEEQKAAETKATETQDTEVKETAADTADAKVEESNGEVKLEQDTPLTELVKSAQQLLQQLIQLMNGTDNNKAAQEDIKQVEATIQAISQKLEQIIAQSADVKENKTDEVAAVLKDLKVELKELVKQLKTQTADTQTIVIDKPSLQQTVNTIKQLINKMNEVKPILQQKLTKPEVMTENAELKVEPEAKQSKDISKAKNTTELVKTPSENVKLDAAAEANAKESTDKDSKENDKESKYQANTKEAPKHQIAVDKHKPEGFKIINMVPNDKADAQINLKELNLNMKKEQMVTINKSDILNQVIKKADIIVHEGHSEMVMKLEPESLGKLNLKIIVEKGLVTAKFIAESQQVKEVLESSFNQLKDALQEKGISVQNFSVSVGQQASDSSSNQSFNQWKQSIKVKNKAVGDFVGLDDEAVMSQNPYNYHDGKFDYRA